MAEIAVGEAITAGFGVIRRKPAAVVLWGLTQFAATALIIAFMAPFYMTLFAEAARGGAGGAPNPAAVQSMAMQMQGLSLLLNLVAAASAVVVYCAVFRSIIHPELSRWGYLRIGPAELYTLVLLIAGYIAFFIAILVAAVAVGSVVAILAISKAVAAAVVVGVIAAVAAAAAAVYVALRFSLAVPMMVDDGQFHLMESWALTRGKVLSLFMIALTTLVILIVAEIVALLVFFVLGLGGLAAIAGNLSHLDQFFRQPPATLLSELTPMLAVFAVLWIPLAGCIAAVWAAPWARAYRDLVQPDVSGAFS